MKKQHKTNSNVKLYTLPLILLTLTTLFFPAKVISQNTVALNLKNVSLIEFLNEIENNTSIRFSYVDQQLDPKKDISIKVANEPVDQVLNKVLMQKGYEYTRTGNTYAITKVATKRVVKLKYSGLVTDDNGFPIIGATVVIDGVNNIGTITDVDGRFSIEAFVGATLHVSYIGYENSKIILSSNTTINIRLKEDTKLLDEVVVIGYGIQRKRDITGAVTRVDVKKLETLPNVNVSQALRGTVAGIQVIDGGRPGQDLTIRIRGNTSITASNDPLIVLDGIPYTGGKLSDINSNDIESIDILKDASSAAIYGSRATNGVILITTKKGTSSKPRLNYNGYTGFSNFASVPQLLGPEKYIQKLKDVEEYKGGQLTILNPLEQANYDAGITINPFDAISQDAPMYNHELSVSGKSDRVNYYLSGSFTDIKSVIQGDRFKRISVRSNFDIEVVDWLKVGMNVGFTNKDNSGNQANLYMATYLSPFANLYYDDGVPRPQPMNIGLVGNPLSSTLLGDNRDLSQILFSNVYTEVKLPLKGLTYRLNLNNTLRDDEVDNYNPSFIREQFYKLGSGSKYHYKMHSLTMEHILKYEASFADIHRVDVTLMYGFEQMKDETSSLSSNNIYNDILGYNNLGIGENHKVASTAGQSQAVSSMGRLGYSLKDRYALNATVRRDGYSAFGEDRKFGVFPSLGFGWTISEENFMDDVLFVDMLKLRLSYGKNGNRGISRYASLSQMATINYVFGDGSNPYTGLYPTSMANRYLGWESTYTYNLGVDFSFFNTRINGSFEVYKMNTKDLLLNLAVPGMTGYNSFLTNIGQTSNRGIEATINTYNIKNKEFSWSTNFVFSLNRNRIEKLSGEDLDGDGKEDDVIANKWFIGYPLGSNYDYVVEGIWQEGEDMSVDPSAKPGYLKFKDVSGNGTIGPEDRQVLHSNEPDFLIGLTNTFAFKGLTFSFMFNWRQGGYSPNSWLNHGTNQYDNANILDIPYWTPSNPLTDRPSIGYPNPRGYGFYEERTFLRLQDITLSYELPKKWMDAIKCQNMSVYASGKNIATWTNWHGWDPEAGLGTRGQQYSEINTPLMRSFIFGLRVGL